MAKLILIGTVVFLAYMAAAGGMLIGSTAAIECRALGGVPTTNLFNLSNVRCIEQRFIPLQKP